MKIVATTSLPAVDRPNADRWNAARSRQNYEEMTADILEDLFSKFDEPEHLPSLAEMTSNMIAICAQKCFKTKQSKKTSKDTHRIQTPFFSKIVQDAYQEHLKICKKWRKSGRPSANSHPSKIAKLESQRRLQKNTKRRGIQQS